MTVIKDLVARNKKWLQAAVKDEGTQNLVRTLRNTSDMLSYSIDNEPHLISYGMPLK